MKRGRGCEGGMKMEIEDEPAIIKWLNFSEKSLSKIEDIELATLKIHIVLEDALRFLLSKRLLVDEDYFDNQRIEFAKLVEIAVAGMNNQHLLGALRALNSARNSISHRLTSTAVLEKLKIFVDEIAYMQSEKPIWPSDIVGQRESLKKAFYDAGFTIFDFAINKIVKNS